MKPRNRSTFPSLILAGSIASISMAMPAFAATIVWNGATGGDLGTPGNWVGGVIPSVATPDTAQWDGTVSGDLSLVYGAADYAGAVGNLGINLNVTGTNIDKLAIDTGANTSAFRMSNLTIASGAGAVTLGDGAGVFNITLGGTTPSTQTWTNDSTNIATVKSDVVLGLGGGGTHTFALGGAGNWAFNNVIGTALSLAKSGAGTATLSAVNAYTGSTTVTGGTLNLTGGSAMTGGLFVNGGGVLNLSGTFGASTTTDVFTVGQAGGKGIVNIGAGVTLSRNNLRLGDNSAGDGAVYQTGGTVALTQGGNVNDFRIGAAAQGKGYYSLAGGSLTANEVGIGGADIADTVGVMDVSAGTFADSGWLTISRGTAASSGVLNVTGGTVTATRVELAGTGSLSANSQSTVNVGGGIGAAAVTTAPSTTIGLNLLSSGNVAGLQTVANLLPNGTLTTGIVNASASALPTAIFNFNGGKLKAATTNAGAGFMTSANIDEVDVFGGGGTVDSNGTSITISRPLLAPAGGGLNANPSFTGGAGYIGAPLVKITGGGGTGATAVATVDPVLGVVTAVTITNPGTNYSSPPTFTFFGGGPTTAATATAATPTANVSGPMTFLSSTGTGTTILSGNNTYTGVTTISSGTLQIGSGGTSGSLGTSLAPISNNGTLAFSRTDTVSLPNDISGTGGLSNISSGTVNVSGNNTYAGNTVITNGILKAATTGSLPNYATAGKVQVSGNGRVGVVSGAWTAANIDTLVANATFSANTAGFAIDTSAGDFSYGSTITGAKSFTKLGANTLTLSANNNYTGATWVNAGTLLINGGTLTGSTITGQSMIINQTGTGTGIVTQNGGTVNTGPGEVWIGQNAGSSGVYNLNAGAFQVNNWLTPGRAGSTGTINITGGTLTHTTTGSAGGRFSIASGGGGAGVGTVNQTAGGVTDSSSLIISELGTAAYNISGGTLTANVNLSMSRGAGTSVLNMQNALSGTTGGLTNGGGTEIVNTPEIVMGDGGAGASTVNLDGGTLVAGRIRNGTGAGTKTVNFNGGVLQLRASDATGALFVSGVTTTVNGGGALVNTNGFNGTISTALTHTGAGAIDGGLVKSGSGTLALTGVNTFTGPITVSGGKLQAGVAGALPSGVDLVSSPAASGSLDFNGQYRVAAAAPPAKTFTNLSAGANSEFIFNLSTTAGTTTGDSIGITNAATVTPGAKLTVSAATGSALTPGNYTLLSGPGGLDNFVLSNSSITTGGFFYPLSLTASPTADTLTIGAAQIAKLFYTGNGLDNLLSNAANFSTDVAGTTAAVTAPTSITDLVFTANAGATANFSPTIGSVTAVNSLEFTGTGTPAATTPVIVSGPGTLSLTAGANTFAAGTGIMVDAGAAAHGISANLALGVSQSITNASTSNFTISGGINGGGSALTLSGLGQKTLTGDLSNLSGLTNNGTGLSILSGNNTFTGPVAITAGTLRFDTVNSLGSGNAVNLAGGTLQFGPGNTTDVTASHALNFNGAGTIDTNGNNIVLAGSLTGTGNGAITKAGAGDLTLSGGASLTANPSNIFVRTGSLTLSGAAENITGTSYIAIGQNAGDRGILNVTGGAKLTGTSDFNLGDVGGTTLGGVNGGIVNLSGAGSSVTIASLFVGKGTSATVQYGYGVLNQGAGSTFTSTGNSQIGAYGIGQYNLAGGTWNHTGGYISVARQTGSFGVVDISGGTLNDSASGSRTIIGELGVGVLNVRNGGVLNNSTTGNSSGGNLTTALAALTLGNSTGATGIVNLLTGGTISTTSVGGLNTGVTAVFNFNGGTLATRSATATFMQNLTTANVFGGGALIDTTAGDGTITQPLLAPVGNGVDSITASGGGFSTTPIVQITGGGGTGATAVAAVDNTGTLTGITITNPGTGYLTPPTVTVTGPFGNQIAGTATLNAGNVSGGLTKSGTNTLTLTAANTFTGVTTISGGTLQLGTGATGNDGTLASTAITNNGTLVYNRFGSLSDASVISGTGSVTKLGAGTQTLTGANSYTGVTTVGGGVLSVADIENGGVNSTIGASTSAPANLVFSGNGSLLYTGPAIVTDRGYTVGTNGGGIDHANDVTFTGQVLSNSTGSFTKNGTGTLAYTNTTGTNALTGGNAGNALGYVVNNGLVRLGGTPGSPLAQTNSITGELIVGTVNTGSSPNAAVEINGGTTNVTSYIGVGRGNGTNNAATSVTVNNNAVVTSGNFAIGYNNGLAGYTSSPAVSFNGSSSYTDTGVFTLGESVNAAGGISTVNVNGTATLSLTSVAPGAVNIGASGAAVLNQNGGSITAAGSVNIARDAASVSTYNLNGGTLTTPAVSKGAGTATFNFNGGVLAAPVAAPAFLQGLNRANVRNGGAFIDTGANSVTVVQALVHSDVGGDAATDGGLTKQGSGTLTLATASTYSGDTTVANGTLELQADDSLADLANVKLATGTTLKLNFVGSDTVSRLYIDGVEQASGTWGRIGSGAAHESALITSDGLLDVTNGVAASPFATWATAHGLTGADALAGADPDSDGYNNLAEFILGGEPNPANPGANTNQLGAEITAAGGNHIFSFRRTQLSATEPGIVIGYEYGSDLIGWTPAVDGTDGIGITVDANGYGTGIDKVNVSIPDALLPVGARFARMHATLP